MILFLADVPLFNPASGAEQVLYQQAIGLAQNKSAQICAITRTNQQNSEVKVYSKNGIQEFRYQADTENVFSFFLQLIKKPKDLYNLINKQTDFKIIVGHQPFTLLSLIITKKLKKLPLLYLFISPSHEEYLLINKNKKWPLRIIHSLLRRTIERICLIKADKIMFLSDYMKQKATCIHGIKNKSWTLNPAGVDLGRFRPFRKRSELKNELAFPPGRVHLLTVRNLEYRMGLDNLLKAIYLLRKNNKKLYLVLGGEGSERDNLKNLIIKYDLSNDVRMTGYIADEDLPNYYSAADFFILPTRELEGFGLVTIESMACETPVLGTPVGATNEILSNFDPGLLFKDNTPEAMAVGIQFAIDEYYNDKDKYQKLRLKCCKYAQENYSWQRHIDQLQLVLNDLTELKQ